MPLPVAAAASGSNPVMLGDCPRSTAPQKRQGKQATSPTWPGARTCCWCFGPHSIGAKGRGGKKRALWLGVVRLMTVPERQRLNEKQEESSQRAPPRLVYGSMPPAPLSTHIPAHSYSPPEYFLAGSEPAAKRTHENALESEAVICFISSPETLWQGSSVG